MTDIATDPGTTTEPTDPEPISPEPEQPTEPAPSAPEPPADATPKAKRSKGELEASVKRVCDDFVSGSLVLEENELLTPHRIAKIVASTGTDASTGAVAATLARWADIGFAVLNNKPLAFVEYTDGARNEGLTALKAAAAERKRAERAAAKAAAPAASDD